MKTKALLSSAVAVILIAAGCGKQEPAAASGNPAPAARSAQTNPAAAADVKKVTVEGNDRMLFDVTRIEVRAGQNVELTFKNVGSLPKEAMGHNWVLLTAGTDVQQFGMAATQARDNDFIPPAMQDRVIAHTRVLGPGEEEVITFAAPTQPGEYAYICSFPGHWGVMRGILVVQ